MSINTSAFLFLFDPRSVGPGLNRFDDAVFERLFALDQYDKITSRVLTGYVPFSAASSRFITPFRDRNPNSWGWTLHYDFDETLRQAYLASVQLRAKSHTFDHSVLRDLLVGGDHEVYRLSFTSLQHDVAQALDTRLTGCPYYLGSAEIGSISERQYRMLIEDPPTYFIRGGVLHVDSEGLRLVSELNQIQGVRAEEIELYDWYQSLPPIPEYTFPQDEAEDIAGTQSGTSGSPATVLAQAQAFGLRSAMKPNDPPFRVDRAVKVRYDATTRKVVDVEGVVDWRDAVELVEHPGVNIPAFVAIHGRPYYPPGYQFINRGPVYYYADAPPRSEIKILRSKHGIDERAKRVVRLVTPEELRKYESRMVEVRNRDTMGESAQQHAMRLVRQGRIVLAAEAEPKWQWCHLIALSMLPLDLAQRRENLVCGTTQFNMQMWSLESAVQEFVRRYRKCLELEVQADHWEDTHFAFRLRYCVTDPKTMVTFKCYFDADVSTAPDFAEEVLMFERLEASLLRSDF